MRYAIQPIAKTSIFWMLILWFVGAETGAAAQDQGSAVDSINRGALTWSQNCSRCHNMRSPTEFRDDLWRPIVTHMRVRAGLTGKQQRDVLAFLQQSNSPAPTSRDPDRGDSGATKSTLSGKSVFERTCIACHGPNGEGSISGVPNLAAVNGPLSKPDAVLVKHITEGFQSPDSPMAMPAKGGNPALSREDILAVLAYMREQFGP